MWGIADEILFRAMYGVDSETLQPVKENQSEEDNDENIPF